MLEPQQNTDRPAREIVPAARAAIEDDGVEAITPCGASMGLMKTTVVVGCPIHTSSTACRSQAAESLLSARFRISKLRDFAISKHQTS